MTLCLSQRQRIVKGIEIHPECELGWSGLICKTITITPQALPRFSLFGILSIHFRHNNLKEIIF